MSNRPQRDLTPLEAAGFAVPGTWMVLGLFLDGWSHRHQRLDSFFTPWHATLYSGFVAAMVWGAWSRYRLTATDPESAARPVAGDRVTTIGLALFAIGAPLDFAWHQMFGIEASIKALLSPTHLLLMTGGVLAATGPVRAAWAMSTTRRPSWREFAPVLVAMTLAVAVLSFFTQEINAFTLDSVDLRVQGNHPAIQQQGIAAVLITSALMMGAWLYLVRRWRPPAGAATVMFTAVAVGMTGLDSFHRLPLVLGASAGGVVADVLVARHPWLTGAAVPAVMWSVWVAVYATWWGVGWHIDLWLGMIIFTVLTGLGLAILVFPPAVPVPVTPTRDPATAAPGPAPAAPAPALSSLRRL